MAITRRSSRRRRGLVVAVVLALTMVTGCRSAREEIATSTTSTAATTPSRETTITTATTAGPSTTTTTEVLVAAALARVWFLRGERVAPAYRPVASSEDAIRALLDGPSADDAGLTSQVPLGTMLRSVRVADGIATVDLTSQFQAGGGSMSMMARLAQLVFTATETPGVARVAIALDGTRIAALGGEGIDVSAPLGRDAFRSFTPFILVEEPRPGALVGSPLRISGQNSTYENTVRVKLAAQDGTVLADTFTTGRGPIYDSDGRPVWGPFEASVAFDPGGAEGGVLTVFDTSAETNEVTNAVSVPLRFAPNGSPSGFLGSSTAEVTTPDTPGGPGLTAHLVDVRWAQHAGYERVVFEFADNMPGYSVRYGDEPVLKDPSGLPVDLLADGVIRVRMSSASGVDITDDGKPTYPGPSRLAVGLPAVHEVVQIGDYEGVLSWVINVWTRPPFRVTSLAGPPRLVIDVASAGDASP